MKFSIYQVSRQGGRRYNQDRLAYSYTRDALLMVAADGMGGHFHGEIAAQITVQTVVEAFRSQARPRLQDPRRFLQDALHLAHDAIGNYTVRHELSEFPRTTCVACVVQDGHAWWGHAGDSRLYYFRGGRLVTRTRDHSVVQQLLEQGRITEAEMATHPERNRIYNCLGGIIPPEVELSDKNAVWEGDVVLLCTDGLWGELSVAEMAAILDTYPVGVAVPELLDHAEFRGGAYGDNLSAIAMRWGDEQRFFGLQRMVDATVPLNDPAARTEVLSGWPKAGNGRPMSDEDIEQTIAGIQAIIRKHAG